jgi:hypothetical protein
MQPAHQMMIGESFVGDGVNAAHVNTVLGHRDGPVGAAWVTALATPRAGFTPFVTIAAPSLQALRNGASGGPAVGGFLAAARSPFNAFYRTP